MSLWTSPPNPVSKLARHRTLSSLAGVCVSQIQLGAMSIGDKWSGLGMVSMDKESSFKHLDAYFDLGEVNLAFLVLTSHKPHLGTEISSTRPVISTP